MGHDLCASLEMEMFGLVFDSYGRSAMICTSLTPYRSHLWKFGNCFVSIVRCFILHVFEVCMMYDLFQARIRQFLNGDPSSNQHTVSQLRDVTTGVAWTLFTVWTWVLPHEPPVVGGWKPSPSRWSGNICWGKLFYVQDHPYVYYRSDLLSIFNILLMYISLVH